MCVFIYMFLLWMGLAGSCYNSHALQIVTRGRLQAAHQGEERREFCHRQQQPVVELEGAPAGLAVSFYLFYLFDHAFIVDFNLWNTSSLLCISPLSSLYTILEPSPVSGGCAE